MHFKIHQVIKIPPEKEDSLEVNETTTIYPDLSDEENIKNTKKSTISSVSQNPAYSGSGLCPIDAEDCFFERFREKNKPNKGFTFPKIPEDLPKRNCFNSEAKESWYRQPSIRTSSSTSYLNIEGSLYRTPSQNTVNKTCEDLTEDQQAYGSTDLSAREGYHSTTKSCLKKPSRPGTKSDYKHSNKYNSKSEKVCGSQSQLETSSLSSGKCRSLTDLEDLDTIRKIKNCYIQNYNDILAVLFETSRNSSARNFKTTSVKSSQTTLEASSQHRLKGGNSSFYYDCQTSPESKASSFNSEEELDNSRNSHLAHENKVCSTVSLENQESCSEPDREEKLRNLFSKYPELKRKQSCKCKGNILKRTEFYPCKSNNIESAGCRAKSCSRSSRFSCNTEDNHSDLEKYFWKLKDLEINNPKTPQNQFAGYQSHSYDSGRSFEERRKALDWDNPEKKYYSSNSIRNHCDSFTILCSNRSKKNQLKYHSFKNCGDENFKRELSIDDPRCIALLIPQGCSVIKNIEQTSCEAQTSECDHKSSNFMRSKSPTSEKSTCTGNIGAICEVLSRSNTSIDSQGRLRSGKSGNIFNIFKRSSSKKSKYNSDSQDSIHREAEDNNQGRRSRREKKKRATRYRKEDQDSRPSTSRPDSSDSRKRTRRERLGNSSICPESCQERRTPKNADKKSRSRSKKRRQESYQDLPTRETCPAFTGIRSPAELAVPSSSPCGETCPNKKGVSKQPSKNKPGEKSTVVQQEFIGQSSFGVPLHISVTKSTSETESGSTQIKCITKKLNPPYGPTQQEVFTKKSTHGDPQSSKSCSGANQKNSESKREVTSKSDTGEPQKQVIVEKESVTECCADKIEYKYLAKETSNNSRVTQESSQLCSVIHPNLDVVESNKRFYCPGNIPKESNQTKLDSFYKVSTAPIFVKVTQQQSFNNQSSSKNPCATAIQESLLTSHYSPINTFNKNLNQDSARRPKSEQASRRNKEVCKNSVRGDNFKGSVPETYSGKNHNQSVHQKYSSSSLRKQHSNQVSRKNSNICTNPICGASLQERLAEIIANASQNQTRSKYSPCAIRKNSNQVSRKNSEVCAYPTCGENIGKRITEPCFTNPKESYISNNSPSTSKRGSYQVSRKNSEDCTNPQCGVILQESTPEQRGVNNRNISHDFLNTVADIYESLKQNANNKHSSGSKRSVRGFRKSSTPSKNLVSDDNFLQSVAVTYAVLEETQSTGLKSSPGSKTNNSSKKTSQLSTDIVADEDFLQSVAETYALLNDKQSSSKKTSHGSKIKIHQGSQKSTKFSKDFVGDENFILSVVENYAVLNDKQSFGQKNSHGSKTNQNSYKSSQKNSEISKNLVADEDFLQSVADTYVILNAKQSSGIKSTHGSKTNQISSKSSQKKSEFSKNLVTDEDFIQSVADTYAILNEKHSSGIKSPKSTKQNQVSYKSSQKSSEFSKNLVTDEDFPQGVAENQSSGQKYSPSCTKEQIIFKNPPKHSVGNSCSVKETQESWPETSQSIYLNQCFNNKYNQSSSKKQESLLKSQNTSAICLNPVSGEGLQKRQSFNKKYSRKSGEVCRNQICGEDLLERLPETCQKQSPIQKYSQKSSEAFRNQICGEEFLERPPETCQKQSLSQKYSEACRNQICAEESQKRTPGTSQKQSFNQKYSKKPGETCRNQICGEDFLERPPETSQKQSFNQKYSQKSGETCRNQICGEDFIERPTETSQKQSFNQKYSQKSGETGRNQTCGADFLNKPLDSCQEQSFNQKYSQKSGETCRNQICGEDFIERPTETSQKQSFNQKYSQKSGETGRNQTCGADFLNKPLDSCQEQSFNQKYSQKSGETGRNQTCGADFLNKPPETCQEKSSNQKYSQKSGEIGQNLICGANSQQRPLGTSQKQSFDQKYSKKSGETCRNQICGEEFLEIPSGTSQKQSFNQKYSQKSGDSCRNQTCGEDLLERPVETCQEQSFNKKYSQKSGEIGQNQVCGADSQQRPLGTSQKQSYNQKYNQKSSESCKNQICSEDLQKQQPSKQSFSQKYSQKSSCICENPVCADYFQESQIQSFDQKYNQKSSDICKKQIRGLERTPETCQQSFNQKHNLETSDIYQNQVCGEDLQKGPRETYQNQRYNQRRINTSSETCKNPTCEEEVLETFVEANSDLPEIISFTQKYSYSSTKKQTTPNVTCPNSNFSQEDKSRSFDKGYRSSRSTPNNSSQYQKRKERLDNKESKSKYSPRVSSATLEEKGSDIRRTSRRERVLSGRGSRYSIRQSPQRETFKERSPKGSTRVKTPENSPRGRSARSSPRIRTPEGTPRGSSRGTPSARSPRGTPRERSPRGTPKERSPRGTPKERSPRGTPKERSPRGTPRERSIEKFSPEHSSTFIETPEKYCKEKENKNFACDCKEFLEQKRALEQTSKRVSKVRKFQDRLVKKDSEHSIRSKRSDASAGSRRSGQRKRSTRRERVLGIRYSDSSLESIDSRRSAYRRRTRRERLLGERESSESIKTASDSSRKLERRRGKTNQERSSDKKDPRSSAEQRRGQRSGRAGIKRSDSSVNKKASPTNSFCKVCPPERDSSRRKSAERSDCLDHRKFTKGKFGYTDSGCTICTEASNCSISSRNKGHTKQKPSPKTSASKKRSDNSINRSKQKKLLAKKRETDSGEELDRYITERNRSVCPPSCKDTPKRVSPKASPIRAPKKKSPSADQTKHRQRLSGIDSQSSICSNIPCRDNHSVSPKISSPQLSCRQSDIFLNQRDKYHYRPDSRTNICSPRICGQSLRTTSPYKTNLDNYLYNDPEIVISRGRSKRVIGPKVAKSRGCAVNLGRTDSGLLRRRDSPCSYSSRYNSNKESPIFPYPSTSRNHSAGRTQSKVSPRVSSSYYSKGTDSLICPGYTSCQSTVKNTNQGYKKSSKSQVRPRVPTNQLTRRPASAISPRRKGNSFTTDIFQCSFCPEKYQQSNLNRTSNTSVCSSDFNINLRREKFCPKKHYSRSKVKVKSPNHSVVYYKNKPGSLQFTLKEIESTLYPPRNITFKSLTNFNEAKEELHSLRESNIHSNPSTCSVACQSRSAETCTRGNLTEKPYKPTWNDLLSYCDSISRARKGKRAGYYRERFCSQPPLSERVRAVIKKLENTRCFDSDSETDSSSQSCTCGITEQELREFEDEMSDRIIFPTWKTPEPGPGLRRYQNRLSGIICPNEHAPADCDCAQKRCICGNDPKEREDFRPSKSVKTRSKKSHDRYGLCPNSTDQSCTCSEFLRREKSLDRERERVRRERKVSFDKAFNKPICPPERPSSQRLSFLDDPPYCSMSSFLSDVNFQKIKSLYKTSHEPSRPSSQKNDSEYYCRNSLPHWVNRDQ